MTRVSMGRIIHSYNAYSTTKNQQHSYLFWPGMIVSIDSQRAVEYIKRSGYSINRHGNRAGVRMKWVTRKNVKVDRVACPWLIKRYIDPHAEFLFVAEEELLEAAKRGAIPFDAPRIPQVKLNHRGDRCTFEAIIEDYRLTAPGLERLALIVRAADVKGQEGAAPEGCGLRAISHGFAALNLSDQERLEHGFPIYDAMLKFIHQSK